MSLTTKKVSTTTLVLITVVSLFFLTMVHNSYGFNPWYRWKMEAARIMQKASELIRQEQITRGFTINMTDDPNGSGLIGEEYSEITTDRGLLDAKMMTTNPNFAALVVDLFKRAKLKEGDLVAICYTGSMPAANLAVISAVEALKLEPIIISSIGASSWGATNPSFTWVDMESLLCDKEILSGASVAASLGGGRDEGHGLRSESKELMLKAIKRNGLAFINEGSLEGNIEARMELFKHYAGGRPIKAYVNVGGGVASLGRSINGLLVPPGLSKRLNTARLGTKGALMRMAQRGIPVIHILKVRELIREYRMPSLPVPLPNPGEAQTFYEEKYSVKIAMAAIAGLLGVMAIFLEVDLFLLPLFRRRRKKVKQK